MSAEAPHGHDARGKAAPETKGPEPLPSFTPLPGLQARLLLGGDAIRPDHTVGYVGPDMIPPLEQRDFLLLEHASKRERLGYWENRDEKTFEMQRAMWRANFIDAVRKRQSDPKGPLQYNKDYKPWKEFLVQFNLFDEGKNDVNESQVDAFYDTYLGSGGGVKRYVTDVIDKYNDRDKVDYPKLHDALQSVRWVANVFGNMSAEVIAQVVDAEGKLQSKKKGLLRTKNYKKEFFDGVNKRVPGRGGALRVNALDKNEQELLEFLLAGRQIAPKPEETIAPHTPEAIKEDDEVLAGEIPPSDAESPEQETSSEEVHENEPATTETTPQAETPPATPEQVVQAFPPQVSETEPQEQKPQHTSPIEQQQPELLNEKDLAIHVYHNIIEAMKQGQVLLAMEAMRSGETYKADCVFEAFQQFESQEHKQIVQQEGPEGLQKALTAKAKDANGQEVAMTAPYFTEMAQQLQTFAQQLSGQQRKNLEYQATMLTLAAHLQK